MPSETERKFVLADPPSADVLGAGTAIRQGYLAEEADTEVRVRITDQAATLTVKAGRGLVRTEVEVALPQADAEALWPHTAGRRIEKVRHRVPVGAVTAEVDLYGGELVGLCTAEVEFADAAEAARFTPPEWLGREVTGEQTWSNAALARQGRVIEAGGGVVWRMSGKGNVKVLVVHRPRYDDWSLPKGKLDPADHTILACALREVQEETGLVCAPGEELPASEYVDRKGRPKRVRYWAMQPVSGEFSPNHEVDKIRWVSLDELPDLVSYPRDQTVAEALTVPPPNG